ncbi:hypothetical protein P4V43_24055 [Brevibacillus fortis]|uniref:hypothetical protein n=1 Tax=Brevibacillus fortis TaxID=2126352 RepID=UPI002E22CF6A|nr:hypothetical protein [Brevibacillus fortis]
MLRKKAVHFRMFPNQEQAVLMTVTRMQRSISAYHSALAGVSLNALGLVDYKNIWFRQ